VALLDKLYDLTREPKLRPREGVGASGSLARLCAAKDVDTQVMIDEAHNRPALPNPFGEALGGEDRQKLKNIGDELKRCWFADADGDTSTSYGKKGAGYLAHKIWRHMSERVDFLCHLRFCQFSCHDTTIAALAAHLGVELPDIGFGAFMLFELHKDPVTRENYVKFFYNSFPTDGQVSYDQMRSIALPLGTDTIVKLDDCPDGSVPLAKFKEHCELKDVEETFEQFTKLLGRADMSPTREALETLLEADNVGWMTFNEWKDKHHKEFLGFDVDLDNALCYSEMVVGLKHWYGITGKTVDLIFNLLDQDPVKDALSEKDVYMAMCALVGVRGSISAKTTGGVVLDNTADLDDVDAVSSGGITKLMVAANTGDLDRLKDLIARGADVNAQDDFGWTALRYAARRKDLAVAEALVVLGADVNLGAKSGRTPLMSAVVNNSSNIVQLLVESGADVNAKNTDGLTAFDLASRGIGSKIVRNLVNPNIVPA
jgi:ankyrin repeat protein